ncbi:MAG TPA: hypothetical protein VLS45_04945 [Methylomicrobium sp.]|nr:hypothetical protein [Methylomicrobium sp.]
MTKKDKDDILADYRSLKNAMVRDKVAEILRARPGNYVAALEEIGFKYYDDDDRDEFEEKNARPENQNQKDLVDYFEGRNECTESILTAFLEEKDAEEPNLPLIRKFFKQANRNLKALILYGLDHYPARIDLLSDLAYFHEFENTLSTLIDYYTRACVNETNLETFSVLAQDFYYATIPDGYEALYALRDLFEPETDKRKAIDFLIQEKEKAGDSSSPIEF